MTVSFFLPVILQGGGFSTELSLILSAPPYVFAAIYTFASAVLSDKVRLRAPFIITSNVVCIIGLAILAYAGKLGPRYFGAFLTIAGAQSNVPAVIAYSQNNIRGASKRGLTSALVIGFGGVGGIIASSEFRDDFNPSLKLTFLSGLQAKGHPDLHPWVSFRDLKRKTEPMLTSQIVDDYCPQHWLNLHGRCPFLQHARPEPQAQGWQRAHERGIAHFRVCHLSKSWTAESLPCIRIQVDSLLWACKQNVRRVVRN